jgi:hypothetical protein
VACGAAAGAGCDGGTIASATKGGSAVGMRGVGTEAASVAAGAVEGGGAGAEGAV